MQGQGKGIESAMVNRDGGCDCGQIARGERWAGTSHCPYYTTPTNACSWHIPLGGIVGAVACPCPPLTPYPTITIADSVSFA